MAAQALAAVVFFIFQSSLATVLDTWLAAIVAWVASWAGIMLVRYYVIENGHVDAWLAGGMVAAALYALLGPRMRRQESLADLAGNLIP